MSGPAGKVASVAVAGSINLDIVMTAERLPGPGETVSGSGFRLALGGKGANQAVAARKLGADVTFVGRTGGDGFGGIVRRALADFGLDLAHVTTSDAAGTGIATIAIDAAGQNAITIVAGANADLSPADLDAADAALRRCGVLLLQCETPLATSLEAARRIRSAGGTVILDPAPVPPQGIAAFAGLADIVTPNESEARLLTGIAVNGRDAALAAARVLVGQGFSVAVVKCGGAGLAWSGRFGEGMAPAFAVPVVDTVAAGDVFNAALGVGLAESCPFPAALSMAQAAAALAVTRPGAAGSAP
ncbi:MAG TPA: ribokinase, partial [Beijerinckiaceae bacterium]|nr:ribokinase [Beijerinckiaceae bacterium]